MGARASPAIRSARVVSRSASRSRTATACSGVVASAENKAGAWVSSIPALRSTPTRRTVPTCTAGARATSRDHITEPFPHRSSRRRGCGSGHPRSTGPRTGRDRARPAATDDPPDVGRQWGGGGSGQQVPQRQRQQHRRARQGRPGPRAHPRRPPAQGQPGPRRPRSDRTRAEAESRHRPGPDSSAAAEPRRGLLLASPDPGHRQADSHAAAGPPVAVGSLRGTVGHVQPRGPVQLRPREQQPQPEPGPDRGQVLPRDPQPTAAAPGAGRGVAGTEPPTTPHAPAPPPRAAHGGLHQRRPRSCDSAARPPATYSRASDR